MEKKLGKTIADAIMTGISYMIPVIVAGALIMALGNVLGRGSDPLTLEGSASYYLFTWGQNLFSMLNVMLGMFTAYRIGGKIALPAGLVAGLIGKETSAGFLGAVVGGLLAGFLADFLNKKIKLPGSMAAVKNLVIVPFFSCIIVFPIMTFIMVPIVTWLMNILTNILLAAESFSPFVFGGILSVLPAVGMGTFPGWAAFGVSMAIFEKTGSYMPITSMLMGGSVCNLGIALAILLAPKKFTEEERAGITSLFVGWFALITEMQLPYVLRDPKRLFPAIIVGAFIGGGLSYSLGLEVPAFHGGQIPTLLANNPLLLYLVEAITAATTAGVLLLLKPKLPATESGIPDKE